MIACFITSPIPETSSLHHGCNRYQLDYIADKEGHAHRISEENYKKIDKIEKYASQRTDFRISNKQMIAFEKQTCLLISANGEIAEAIDSALATRILPAVSAAVRDNLKEEDDSLKDTLEFVYGEENMPAASAFIEMQEEAKTKISNAEARLNEELARKASAENALLEKTEESKDETDAPEAIVAEETEAPVAEETEAETEAEAVAEESETAEEAEAVAEESETAEEAEATEDSADSENDESTAEA